MLPFFNTPQLLPLIVGERAAREMLLLGRSHTAEQALEMGSRSGRLRKSPTDGRCR